MSNQTPTTTDDPFPTYIPDPTLPIDYVYPVVDVDKPPRQPKPPKPPPTRNSPRFVSDKEWAQVVDMYRAGIPWGDIGRTLGINAASLRKKAYRMNLTNSKKKIAEAKLTLIQGAKADTAIAERAQEDMKLTVEAMGEAAKQRLAEDILGTMDRVDTYPIEDLDAEGKREQVVASVVKRSSAIFGWKDGEQAPAINVAILNALPDIERDGPS